jgi:hypothetical protein
MISQIVSLILCQEPAKGSVRTDLRKINIAGEAPAPIIFNFKF